jgi:hypothetical protein
MVSRSGDEPVAFLSYVHADDEHDDGLITAFRRKLEGELRAQTGYRELRVFQDRDDIAWGQAWRDRVDNSLDAATFLIPVVTPAFLASEQCRRELDRFLGRERRMGRADLVLPVYWITVPALEPSGGATGDGLAVALADRQYADWRELRFRDLTEPMCRRAVAALAGSMRDVLDPGAGSGHPGSPARPGGDRSRHRDDLDDLADVRGFGEAGGDRDRAGTGSRGRVVRLVALASALLVGLALSAGVVLRDAFANDEPVVVRGAAASKSAFLEDPEVKRILADHHIRIDLDNVSGSRAIARDLNRLEGLDFAFVSGRPAAELIQRSVPVVRRYEPFSSPIVLATYRPYAEALRRAGIVGSLENPAPGRQLYYTIDMGKFVAETRKGLRWDAIGVEGNRDEIRVQTSDVCDSNSAETYMNMVAFAANGDDIPRDAGEADALARDVKPLLAAQGMPTDEMETEYFSEDGPMDGPPIVVLYEHQYLARQFENEEKPGGIDYDRVVMYPARGFTTQPVLVALTPEGDRLGELLDKDPRLQRRAAELGFRGTMYSMPDVVAEYGMPAPPDPDRARVLLPELTLLERMVEIVGGQDCR